MQSNISTIALCIIAVLSMIQTGLSLLSLWPKKADDLPSKAGQGVLNLRG